VDLAVKREPSYLHAKVSEFILLLRFKLGFDSVIELVAILWKSVCG